MSDPSSYVYQVLNWDRLFENNKSRERDQLHFVCVPNKQDGMGLTRVLNHPNGAAIYGIWQLILGACSRQARPRDGWLTDTGRAPDGQEAGTPWTPEDLALRWRRPVAEIEETLRVLSAPNIQWIRALPLKVPVECPDSAKEVPVWCLGTEREGTGLKGREVCTPKPPEPNGSPAKRPSGIPSNEDQAVEWASMENVPPDFSRELFHQCEGVGWVDGVNRPILSWRSYARHRFSVSQTIDTRSKHPTSIMDIKSVIAIKEEKAKKLRDQYYNDGPVGGSWNNEESRKAWVAIRGEIKTLKQRIEEMV